MSSLQFHLKLKRRDFSACGALQPPALTRAVSSSRSTEAAKPRPGSGFRGAQAASSPAEKRSINRSANLFWKSRENWSCACLRSDNTRYIKSKTRFLSSEFVIKISVSVWGKAASRALPYSQEREGPPRFLPWNRKGNEKRSAAKGRGL